jgi:hypothetical protein
MNAYVCGVWFIALVLYGFLNGVALDQANRFLVATPETPLGGNRSR